jgi:phosphonatase-like hydrolase
MSLTFDLAVFDMIGTTVQDRGEAERAFRAALAEVGVAPSAGEIKAVRGASKRSAMQRLLATQDSTIVDKVYRHFLALASAEYRATASAAEGAANVFSFLRDRNVAVALNTGLDREIAELLLEALHWPREGFAAVVCGDDVAEGRPAPDLIRAAMRAAGVTDPRRVINIGDTKVDLEAGAAAGTGLNIGVCSGAHGCDTLVQAPHTHLIDTVADLSTLLLSLPQR